MALRLKYRTTKEGERIILWGYIISIPLLILWFLFLMDFILPKYEVRDTIEKLYVPVFKSRRSSYQADWANVCMTLNSCRVDKNYLEILKVGKEVKINKSLIFNITTLIEFENNSIKTTFNIVNIWWQNLIIFGLLITLIYWSYIRIRKLEKVIFLIALSIILIFSYFSILLITSKGC